jgi:predicted nucleic acid-binding protein
VKICVDTVIFIDILKDEHMSFQEKLYAALAAKETLIAPAVVYAELMPQFAGNTKLVASFLKDHKISIAPLEIDAVGIAGAKWMRYLKRKSKSKCPNCGQKLSQKEHFLSDFYIGGFALAKCDAILTRDRGIYKKYFPELRDYEPK